MNKSYLPSQSSSSLGRFGHTGWNTQLACGIFRGRAALHRQISSVIVINASVVQGSVIGPSEFVVGIACLQPVSSLNWLMNYADDSYLLIGSRNLQSAQDELSHVSS